MGSRRSFLSKREMVVIFWRESPMGTTLTSTSSAVPPQRIPPVPGKTGQLPTKMQAGLL
jgi:hypothetical protein